MRPCRGSRRILSHTVRGSRSSRMTVSMRWVGKKAAEAAHPAALRRHFVSARHLQLAQYDRGRCVVTKEKMNRSDASYEPAEKMARSAVRVTMPNALGKSSHVIDRPSVLESRGNNPELRGPGQAFGLDGRPLDLMNLPESQTIRWVMRRKMEVLTAIRFGLLNFREACTQYGISLEELLSWKSALDRFGPVGLNALRLRRQNSISKKASIRREKDRKGPKCLHEGRA